MTTQIKLLPLVTLAVSASQDGDLTVPIAFQNAGGLPIDLTGISFGVILRTSASTPTISLNTAGTAFILNGGIGGNLTLAVPQSFWGRIPAGTYVGDLVATADGATIVIGSLTVVQSPIGGCLITSFTTASRNAATAGSVGYIPGPGWNQYRGDYSNATIYLVNDVVYFAFSSWICTAPTTGNAPVVGSPYWHLIAPGVDPAVVAAAQALSGQVSALQTALANLTSAALTDASAAGRALLTAASASAQKALLAIGSADIADATSFGRALLTAPNLAAQLTALGAGSANGVSQLDATGKVPTSQLPAAVLGDVKFQNTWNASTNSPAIPAAAATNQGWYYVVAVAGSTSISGITDWQVGDWLVSNGTSWNKIDNTDLVTSIAGRIGDVVLSSTDITDATALGRTLLTLASAATGRVALSAAAAGANTDITSLAGLTTALSIAQGGTGAATAAAALIALGAVGRTPVADAAYTGLAADRTIAFTALTAARIVTLPAASAYPTGTPLLVVDETGACSSTNTITLARAGTDTINGAASATIALPYGFLALVSNGAGKWTIVDQSTASMGQQSASSVAITGGAIDGTKVGATTPSTGAFTTLSVSLTLSLPANSLSLSYLPTLPAGMLLGNATGATANVTPASLSTYMDAALGNPAPRGTIIVKGASGFVARTPNAAGQIPTFDGTDTNWAVPGAAVTLFPGLLSGLTLANNSTNPNTSLDIGAGTAASDDASVRMTLASAVTKTMGTWAAGGTSASPAGGLDTGTATPNTWYHVFIIYNPTTLTTDPILSLSATAPTLPSGYTKKRRVGSIKTTSAATNFTLFSQRGDEFLWFNAVADVSMASGFNTTAALYTLSVPPGIKTNALFAATVGTNNAYIQSPDQSGVQGTSGTPSTSAGSWANLNIRTNAASQVQAYAQTANSSFFIITSGWIDTRGK